MKAHSQALTLLLSGVVSLAHAAPPVAQFYCASGGNFLSGESQVNPNPVALKFNLSYYDLGVVSSSPNSGTGAPAGKTSPQVVSLHASLARFADLYGAVTTGGNYSECSLETTSANGDIVLYRLKSVTFQSADAIASSTTQSAFTAATLSYLGIEILIVQSGPDIGGAGPAPN